MIDDVVSIQGKRRSGSLPEAWNYFAEDTFRKINRIAPGGAVRLLLLLLDLISSASLNLSVVRMNFF